MVLCFSNDRWAWMFPKKSGLGKNNFLYLYNVPNGTQHIQVEGKLTFAEFQQLVQAVKDGSAYGSKTTPYMESWAAFDPLDEQAMPTGMPPNK